MDDEQVAALSPNLRIDRVEHEQGVVLTVVGDIELATARELNDSLDQSLRDAGRLLVVDLDGVAFLGSVGLYVLVETRMKVGPDRLRIVARSSAARRAIERTALDQVLAMFPTVADALTTTAVDPSPRVGPSLD